MYSTRPPGAGTDNRAASAIVGLVLLFGIVIAGAGIIFWAGMDAKQSVQSASEVDSAETSLQEVSTKLSTLSFKGDGAVTSFDLSGKDSSDVSIVDDGEIRFELNGKSTCSAKTELGSIIYENDNGDTVAYQAGAVFKKTEAGVTVVQSPSLEYQTKVIDGTNVRTLRFPITNVSGDVRGSGTVTATANTSKSGRFQKDLCLAGPNTDEIDYVREIKVTVEGSSYYEAWEQHFRKEFGVSGTISVDDANQKVTVVAPLGSGVTPDQFEIEDEEIYGAIFSGSSSGELILQTQHATVNSYDSSNGPWGGSDPTYGSDGTIITRGNVEIQANGAMVDGNVYAEGTLSLSTSCKNYCIYGDAFVNNSTASGPVNAIDIQGGASKADVIEGAVGNGTIVPDVPTMDATIDDTLSTVQEYNNNDDVSVVSSNQIQFSGGSATVESGVYYLDDLSVPNGNTLKLDTSSGDIVFAVDGDVEIGDDARVKIVGPGQVRTFVGESPSGDDQLTVGESAKVRVFESSVQSYRSNAFFVACKAGCGATFHDGSGGPNQQTNFTGVVYGPGEAADDGKIDLGKDVHVFGALVAGTVEFEQQSEFHFDTDLKNSELDEDGDGVPDVVDDDNGFPDGDGDGFSESEDDCPNVAGTGENGCAGVTEDEDANTLIVNQSSATITVIGSQIANKEVTTEPKKTRRPANVELVIDDSGSMQVSTVNAGNPSRTREWGSWGGQQTIAAASYANTYYDVSPPAGEQWRVESDVWVCTERNPGGRCMDAEERTLTDIVGPDESIPWYTEENDDIERRFATGSTVTVPSEKIYIVDDDPYGLTQSEYETNERYLPGETFSYSEHQYYNSFDIGNDPTFERLDAAKNFVGQMNDSKDHIGVVRFSGSNQISPDGYETMQGLTGNFANVNGSLDQSNWDSIGKTNIAESLKEAMENLNASADNREGLPTKKTIVILTDGKHTEPIGDVDGDTDAEDYWKEILGVAKQAHSANITIYTVALGDGSDTNQTLLKDIANTDKPETDGKFYHVENAGDLEEEFGKIANATSTEQTTMIQHANTSTTIYLGGDEVNFNTNTNLNNTYPSKTVDSSLDPGDAVHFATNMYECDGLTEFGNITNDSNDETYDKVRCENNGDEFAEQSNNSDDAKHQIFTDGDDIPSVQTDVWYKTSVNNSIQEMVQSYNASLVNGDQFTLPENDAIILVNITDNEPNDQDFMVIHFDANDQAPPEPEDQEVDTPDEEDDESETEGDGTSNDYVISIPSSNVNVSAGSQSLAPTTPSVTGVQNVLDDNTASWPTTTATPAADVRD